jgi:carbamoyl-phosphate synthase large subunit
VLGTKMQSVGEVMALGRTFTESVQKACRSLETGRLGLNGDPGEAAYDALDDDELVRRAAVASPDRLFHLEAALRRGISAARLHDASGVDPWFLDQIASLVEERARIAEAGSPAVLTRADWRRVKRAGFADAQLAHLWGVAETDVRDARKAAGVTVTYKTVDTCAAEFAARTPYHYSTWEDEDEVAPLERPAVVILGSGPNRIGQGIEFDYCCVHAAFELSAAGFETVMVNCNPETVSTDYDTSDRLFFEPLTPEDVLHVCEAMGPNLRGVIVSLGGQTPLKLAHDLQAAGVPVLGTSPESIDLAEDRERFNSLCDRLGIPQPPGGVAVEVEAAVAVANRVEYPVLVRPSYVLGGRAMEIVYDEAGLRAAMAALAASAEGGFASDMGERRGLSATRPVLIDRFLEDAT